MIDFLQGTLFSVEEDSIVINVNGVGYQVFVPRPEGYSQKINQSVFIYTHHYMREDWMGLFGFNEKDERYLFRLLLNVSGIGPKGALAIIAQGNPNDVIQAIANEDEKSLVKLPGVGKKTAQRIILDLKDKVKGLKFTGAIQEREIDSINNIAESQIVSDLHDALLALGYQEQEINKVLSTLSDSIDSKESLDRLIKRALQLLMKD
ncbi:Holliday junction DNA helicase RuvA [Vulcanibacillus modesticaldus]|uniref:Holliday junction branch migration complex subunit RuvA n=1 Tax=Vulcanibacillus modesticaldus TaxID=337097 RepID=A0A1D2YWT9_9BACI|nr:Holliday junction branch migration protein RuvA [Vulcanibacillus modesticaldus]OEG00189.1 Holliday junction DNA helicase RuvA [Vulcanibacillus modesticaldus]